MGNCSAGSLPSADSDADLVGDRSVFVVSLYDGVGGGLLACQARTPKVQAHIVESEPLTSVSSSVLIPHVTADSDILILDMDSLLSRVDSAQWELLILIGGPPCQPFSHLGSEKPVSTILGPALYRHSLVFGIPYGIGWIVGEAADNSACYSRESLP